MWLTFLPSRTTEMTHLVGGTKADLGAHLARLLVHDRGLARTVLSNEDLLQKIASKGFIPNDVLNKLQSGQGSWSHFDSAVLKLEAKLTDLAWIVFARRFKCLASLGSVRRELERLLPDVVGIWIQGDKEEEDEEDGEGVEETPGDTLCDELEDDATEADQAEAAVHYQDPAAPTSSTRKPDGWGSRSICKMLERLATAVIEGKGFSLGQRHALINPS